MKKILYVLKSLHLIVCLFFKLRKLLLEMAHIFLDFGGLLNDFLLLGLSIALRVISLYLAVHNNRLLNAYDVLRLRSAYVPRCRWISSLIWTLLLHTVMKLLGNWRLRVKSGVHITDHVEQG